MNDIDEFGGVALDEFGGVPVSDEFGGVPVEESPSPQAREAAQSPSPSLRAGLIDPADLQRAVTSPQTVVDLARIGPSAAEVEARSLTPDEQANSQFLQTPLLKVPRQAIAALPNMGLIRAVSPTVATDLTEGTARVLEGLTSPEGIAVGAGLAGLTAALPPAGLMLGAGLGAKGLGESAGTAVGALESGDTREATRQLPTVAASALMTVAPAAGALKGARVSVPPVIEQARAAGLPRAAEAVEQTGTQLSVSQPLGIVPEAVAKLETLKRGNELIDGTRIKTAIAQQDVMPGRDWVASPEFEFRKQPEAARLATAINEAELTYKSQTSHDIQRFESLKEQLSPGEQQLVTKALREVEAGTDAAAVEKLSPAQQTAAREIRTYFDEIRDFVRRDKEQAITRELTGPQQNALRQINDGVEPAQAFRDNALRESGQAIVNSALGELRQVRQWGIEDYITHIERGSYRVITDDGVTIARAETRPEAAIKADRYLKENPETRSLTLTDEFDPGVEFPTQLSRGQYFRLVQRLKDRMGEDAAEVQRLLRQRGSIVAIKPTNKYAAPLQQRRNILKGEENVFDVLPLYAHVMRKKLALDPVLRDARTALPKLPENTRGQLEELLLDVKGRKTIADKIADYALAPLGVKPFAYSRGVNVLREANTNLKLGYRPVAAAVNRISGLQHTWTKVGSKYLADGERFLRTPEGQRLLDENKSFLGIEASFIHEGRPAPTEQPWWKPLGMFQKAEKANRPESFAALYKYGTDALNLPHPDAVLYARNATRFGQFAYNMASLPRLMRGPSGRLLMQFKPYLVKEMEFISTLRGAEIPRYLTGFMLTGGPRAALYTIKSLPVLGILGFWDDIEDWLNQNAPRASRGVGGALGVDVSPSVAFQFPQTADELLGPTFSDISRLWRDVLAPALRGEDRDFTDVRKWAARLAPIVYSWSKLTESIMAENGWITDVRGRPEYKPSTADKLKMVLGAKPLEKSIREVESRYLRESEEIQRADKARFVDKYLNALEAKDGEEVQRLADELGEMGVTVEALRSAARNRSLDARQRLFRSLPRIRRAEEAERFQDTQP